MHLNLYGLGIDYSNDFKAITEFRTCCKTWVSVCFHHPLPLKQWTARSDTWERAVLGKEEVQHCLRLFRCWTSKQRVDQVHARFPPLGPALSHRWQAQHRAIPTFLLPDELEKTQGSSGSAKFHRWPLRDAFLRWWHLPKTEVKYEPRGSIMKIRTFWSSKIFWLQPTTLLPLSAGGLAVKV